MTVSVPPSDTEMREQDLSSRVLTVLRALMTHVLFPTALILPATGLVLPSLWVGLRADDYVHRGIVSGVPVLRGLYPSRLDIFAFVGGNPERTRRMVDLGILPWWTLPGARLAFWRPVSAITHWLDYTAWPSLPVPMHIHSLAWFSGAVTAVAFTYRRLMGATWAAGLAALLYALDHTHSGGAAWLASRNILLGTLFGALTLLLHDRWRRAGWRPGAVAGPVTFLVGLLSTEASVATAGYLVAHAMFLDRDVWRRRLFAILPYGAIALGWQVLYQWLGYGSFGASPGYVNPALEPILFARTVVDHGPILLLAQWLGLSAETYPLLSPELAWVRWLGSLLALGLLGLMLLPLLRRDSVARFWGLGQVLALLPIAAAPPNDRYLFFVGLGAMGLLAQFLCGLLDGERWLSPRVAWRVLAMLFCYLFIVLHLVVSPIQLFRASTLPEVGDFAERSADSIPAGPEITRQTVVIVNVPSAGLVGGALLFKAAQGQLIPSNTRLLAASAAPVRLSRVDARTLIVRTDGAQDYLFRPRQHPMTLSERVRLTGVTIEVIALTADGRPAEAAFRFDADLDDPALRWLLWGAAGHPGYAAFSPPPVGETVYVR